MTVRSPKRFASPLSNLIAVLNTVMALPNTVMALPNTVMARLVRATRTGTAPT